MSTLTKTITRSYERPVTQRKRLGGVPNDRLEITQQARHGLGKIEYHPGSEGGPKDVYREVPQYHDNGHPRMEKVTETLTKEPYEAKRRGLGCGLLGALAGALGAASILAAGPLGIAVAASLGAVAGSAVGSKSAENDEVREVWNDRPIIHPHMKGHTAYTVPIPAFEKVCTKSDDGEPECKTEVKLAGYVHHHRPDIREETVGTFQEPSLEHSRRMNPVLAGTVAAGAGLAIGLVAAAVEKSLK